MLFRKWKSFGKSVDTMPTNSTYCPLPYKHSVIRMDGRIALCCADSSSTPHNIKTTKLDEFWQSEYMHDVRHKMFAGIKCQECQSCYTAEAQGFKSRRQDAIEKYGYIYLSAVMPVDVEFHVSNLCNAKCLICRPRDSSSYASENKMLGIVPGNNPWYDEMEYIPDDVLDETLTKLFNHGLSVIDLRGGESMMVPRTKKILNSIDPNLVKDTTLKVQTNGTKFDAEWRAIFKKFKSVEVMVSIDAHGKDNEYFRYGCSWSKIENFVREINAMPNVSWFINCTVGNLNVLTLPKLFDWVNRNSYTIHISMLKFPPVFQPYNLPSELGQLAAERLEPYIGKMALEKTNQNLEVLVTNLETFAGQSEIEHDYWKEFVEHIKQRDAHRGNSIINIVPEMEKYFA